ncbi:hypothetical protein TrRE_jg6595, partial [Triparma retinervis]
LAYHQPAQGVFVASISL